MTLTATLTRCHKGNPLIVLDDLPFHGLETTPGDLRALAQQLLAVADMAGKMPLSNKKWRATKVTMNSVIPQPTTREVEKVPA
jgi:hypothetical protein